MSNRHELLSQVAIVNQSLLDVVENLENISLCEAETTTSQSEKLGIKTQLYARCDFHMEVAKRALKALETSIGFHR